MNTNNDNPLTPRAQAILDKAHLFSKACGHSYVGTEHILIGLLSLDSGCSVIGMLTENGVDVPKLREVVRAEIKGGSPSAQIPKTELSELVALMRMLADRIDNL